MGRGSKYRKWRHAAVMVALVAAAALLVRRQFPDPEALIDQLSSVNVGWAALAVAAGLTSQLAFALQQHELLAAFRVPVNRRDTIALTSAANAISTVVPAGAVVSVAYTFRQYVARGATSATATAVTVLSGVVSAVALITLAAGGLVTAAPALLAVPAAALLIVVVPKPRLPVDRARVKARLTGHPRLWRLARETHRVLRLGRQVRARDWAAVVVLAAGKWVFDLACLMLIAAAFGADLRWEHLAGVYLTVQVVRQVPLTPGGLGVIEASLLAGLAAAGATAAEAVGIVVGYRLISFWLMLPAGLAGYLYLRRDGRDAGEPAAVGTPPGRRAAAQRPPR
ncbi:YbhN family protein [Actinoplanes sp. NPDC049802]|uniref:lysylphosphatidylglycerol synthase transmembrane domain-containing protein n=1 Tax=Actinoplanes sp. NPDC049802 TaxID=3154742 RepID=UPI0034113DAF